MNSIVAPLLASLTLSFQNPRFNPKKTIVVAVGKAATLMYTAFCENYPDYLLSDALLIIPSGYPHPTVVLPHVQLIKTTHPQISEKSLIAGKKLLESIASSHITSVVALVSGGSSASVELLEDVAQLEYVNKLVTSDKSIVEINAIRVEKSLIKGGKLTLMFPSKRFSVAVMNDIPAKDGYKMVGSMPFWSPRHLHNDIYEVAGARLIVNAVKQELTSRGYTISFSTSLFMGSHAQLVALVKNKIALLHPGEAAIIAGESTLKIERGGGKGGRMSHLVISLIDDISDSISVEAFATDGVDGNSFSAGGVIPFNSHDCCSTDDVRGALACFDSATLMKKLGFTIEMKATGLNLNDIVIILKK